MKSRKFKGGLLILGLAGVLAMGAGLAGCTPKTEPTQDNPGEKEEDKKVSAITVALAKSKLKVGETTNASVTVTPTDAKEKGVTYSSSDPKIATVSEEGLVRAVAIGTAKIIATAKDGSGVKGEVTIEVEATPVESIVVSATDLEIVVGGTTTVSATVSPEAATDKSFTWSSENTELATVSETGLVTGVGIGKVKIIATANDGSGVVGNVEINVLKAPVAVTTLNVQLDKTELLVGETANATVAVVPEDADNKSVTWSSSDESIATVSEEGLVTGVNNGTVKIIATANDGSGVTGEATLSVKHDAQKLVDALNALRIAEVYQIELSSDFPRNVRQLDGEGNVVTAAAESHTFGLARTESYVDILGDYVVSGESVTSHYGYANSDRGVFEYEYDEEGAVVPGKIIDLGEGLTYALSSRADFRDIGEFKQIGDEFKARVGDDLSIVLDLEKDQILIDALLAFEGLDLATIKESYADSQEFTLKLVDGVLQFEGLVVASGEELDTKFIDINISHVGEEGFGIEAVDNFMLADGEPAPFDAPIEQALALSEDLVSQTVDSGFGYAAHYNYDADLPYCFVEYLGTKNVADQIYAIAPYVAPEAEGEDEPLVEGEELPTEGEEEEELYGIYSFAWSGSSEALIYFVGEDGYYLDSFQDLVDNNLELLGEGVPLEEAYYYLPLVVSMEFEGFGLESWADSYLAPYVYTGTYDEKAKQYLSFDEELIYEGTALYKDLPLNLGSDFPNNPYKNWESKYGFYEFEMNEDNELTTITAGSFIQSPELIADSGRDTIGVPLDITYSFAPYAGLDEELGAYYTEEFVAGLTPATIDVNVAISSLSLEDITAQDEPFVLHIAELLGELSEEELLNVYEIEKFNDVQAKVVALVVDQDIVDNFSSLDGILAKADILLDLETRYAALTNEQKVFVVHYDLLTAARAEFDAKAVEAVISGINAIPEFTTFPEAYAALPKIVEAENIYLAIKDESKSLVTNYETLVAKRTSYDTLAAAYVAGMLAKLPAAESIMAITSFASFASAANYLNNLESLLTTIKDQTKFTATEELAAKRNAVNQRAVFMGDYLFNMAFKTLYAYINQTSENPMSFEDLVSKDTLYCFYLARQMYSYNKDASIYEAQGDDVMYPYLANWLNRCEKEYANGIGAILKTLLSDDGSLTLQERGDNLSLAEYAFGEIGDGTIKTQIAGYASYLTSLRTKLNEDLTARINEILGTLPETGATTADEATVAEAEGLLEYYDKVPTEVQTKVAAARSQINVSKVVALIEALPAASDITADTLEQYEPQVVAARQAFNALSETEQAAVGNELLNTLTALEAKIEEVKSSIRVANANELLNALPENPVGAITLNTADSELESIQNAYNAAKSAYDALTDDEKNQISSELKSRLEMTGTRLTAVKTSLAKIEETREALSRLPEDASTIEGGEVLVHWEDFVQDTRAKYNALSEEEKAYFNSHYPDLVSRLVACEERINQLKNA